MYAVVTAPLRAAPRWPHGASTPSTRCALLALGTTIQGGRAALRGAFDDAGPVAEPHAEENVDVREEAVFQREDDELCAAKACAEERADLVRVGQVERGVDLVEDVHRRRVELQQCHDQR